MLKHEIRKLFLQKRAVLSEQQKNEFSSKLAPRFLDQLDESCKTVHIFLPIQLKNEIDTWPIIRQLWKLGIEVVVPIVHSKEIKISNCHLSKNTQLSENKWGVPEPVNCTEIENDKIDVVVLPLLAFDKNGYRVGYGKGYYDRFLVGLSKDVLKVGLSYFPAIDAISDINLWDIQMDMCITPQKTHRF